jgi:hypothetical protein
MPRHIDHSKHCVDCEKFKGCEIRLKVESFELYDLLDPVFETFLGVNIDYTLYSFIALCSSFEKKKESDPAILVMNKVMNGEELSDEEQELLDRIMQSV